jgi:GrpB-like predicted nucleotidyltransferase (UPF0157 family)
LRKSVAGLIPGDRWRSPVAGPTKQAMAERVIIVPYDPNWPRQFEQVRTVMAGIFAGCEADIEHVGSTAVPGLGAKPVIDVMIGLSELAEADNRIAALEAAGYEYVQKYEREMPERRYFRKPRVGPRACHVHSVVKGSEFWVRHLAFRDHLRAHPATVADYYELKRDLAMRSTKEEYTEAKSPFIEGILGLALRNDL